MVGDNRGRKGPDLEKPMDYVLVFTLIVLGNH